MMTFSKNTQNILTYLAIIIILYGAYKAMFQLREGNDKDPFFLIE